MAAVALALSSGGAIAQLETTVLLTVEDTLEALRRANQVTYRPPGAQLALGGAPCTSEGLRGAAAW